MLKLDNHLQSSPSKHNNHKNVKQNVNADITGQVVFT